MILFWRHLQRPATQPFLLFPHFHIIFTRGQASWHLDPDPAPPGPPTRRPQGSSRANIQFKHCPPGLEPGRGSRASVAPWPHGVLECIPKSRGIGVCVCKRHMHIDAHSHRSPYRGFSSTWPLTVRPLTCVRVNIYMWEHTFPSASVYAAM